MYLDWAEGFSTNKLWIAEHWIHSTCLWTHIHTNKQRNETNRIDLTECEIDKKNSTHRMNQRSHSNTSTEVITNIVLNSQSTSNKQMKKFFFWLVAHRFTYSPRILYANAIVCVCVCARVLCASLCEIYFFCRFVCCFWSTTELTTKEKKSRTENFAKATMYFFRRFPINSRRLTHESHSTANCS